MSKAKKMPDEIWFRHQEWRKTRNDINARIAEKRGWLDVYSRDNFLLLYGRRNINDPSHHPVPDWHSNEEDALELFKELPGARIIWSEKHTCWYVVFRHPKLTFQAGGQKGERLSEIICRAWEAGYDRKLFVSKGQEIDVSKGN